MPGNKKLLPVITEAEPAENDVRDPRYLRFDAKKSVEDLSKNGILTTAVPLKVIGYVFSTTLPVFTWL